MVRFNRIQLMYTKKYATKKIVEAKWKNKIGNKLTMSCDFSIRCMLRYGGQFLLQINMTIRYIPREQACKYGQKQKQIRILFFFRLVGCFGKSETLLLVRTRTQGGKKFRYITDKALKMYREPGNYRTVRPIRMCKQMWPE